MTDNYILPKLWRRSLPTINRITFISHNRTLLKKKKRSIAQRCDKEPSPLGSQWPITTDWLFIKTFHPTWHRKRINHRVYTCISYPWHGAPVANSYTLNYSRRSAERRWNDNPTCSQRSPITQHQITISLGEFLFQLAHETSCEIVMHIPKYRDR